MKFAKDYVQIGGIMHLKKLFICALALYLGGCGSYFSDGKDVEYVKDPYNPNRMITKEKAKKIGTVGFNFGNKGDDKPQGYRHKNYFLWSACVDVLSELPPKISDAAGGIYTTDYVLTKDGNRQSLQCRVLGEKVLSKNVEITVFTMTPEGQLISSKDSNELKSNVLIRARELKAQYDNKV